MIIKYIDRTSGKIEIENPPAETFLRFLYANPVGTKVLLPLVKQKLITKWYGRKMDKKSSVKKIKSFIDDLNIDINESQKNIDEFKSFNDFFYRRLKPDLRPIGTGLISPGDGRIFAFKNYADVNIFYVKGRKFTLSEFLGSQSLANKYNNASMIILRLAPKDYHRYHFPFSGIPSESKKIKGYYYSVSPYALLNNFTKVFCENKREVCTLEIPEKNPLLIVPVGATLAGSINSSFKPNQFVGKGDEMGYFAFGGSSIVLFFYASDFKISSDLLQNTKRNIETYVKMGEEIATEI